MRVAIVGSRDFPNADQRVRGCVYELCQFERDPVEREYIMIVSGGARGVDTAAVEAAKTYDLDYAIMPANWNLGRHAGYLRNVDIVDYADRVIAFWDGESKGTKHTIDLALKAKKHLEVIFP